MSRKDQNAKLICRAVNNDDHPDHPINEGTGQSTNRATVLYDLLEEWIFEQFVTHLNDTPY
ncbi:hypothetical protein [Microbacterium sp.]|uniref:hypothetical protein n=1 Tax=Microbacterium sp. TaxID=51671 RepID=UPI0026307DCB|nr:hypothetical protein [Microbacterium sp.]